MTLVLASILVLAPMPSSSPLTAEAGPAAVEAAALAEPVIQYQHDLAVPDIVFGASVTVRGIPGSSYELHVRFDDGESMFLTSGVIPASGTASYGWAVGHEEFPQRKTRAELWTVSDAPMAALAELVD